MTILALIGLALIGSSAWAVVAMLFGWLAVTIASIIVTIIVLVVGVICMWRVRQAYDDDEDDDDDAHLGI